MKVNDGARLWVQDTLLIDAFENEVSTSLLVEFKAINATLLVKDRLADVILEYREATGFGGIELWWESRSQDKRIVPTERLYYRSQSIQSSPFAVQTFGVKSTPPQSVSLAIATWDALTVSFVAPADDGGSVVDAYLVEWWTTGTYGTPETQVVKLDKANTGGTFTLELDAGYITGPIAASALYTAIEAALEALDGAGDVSVSMTSTATTTDFRITFLSRVGVVPQLTVDASQLDGSGLVGVCAKGTTTPSGNPGAVVTCTAIESVTSTVNILGSSSQVSLDIRRGDPYQFTIPDLTQVAATALPSAPGEGGTGGPGFDIRVTAHTSAGYGLPSTVVSLKPMAVPAAPENVALRLVAGVSTSLRVVWDAPLTDNSAQVTHYVVEWALWDLASQSNGSSVQSFRETDSFFLTSYPSSLRHKYMITGLTPGVAYVVTVRAENIMGLGPVGSTVPSFEVPRSKATQLTEGLGGVALSVIPASPGAVAVADSSSSLRLAWLPSPNSNGAAVTSYVLEWFDAPERPEVQIIKIAGQSNADVVTGTFQVSYAAATTDDLAVDVSESELQRSLEALPSLRRVRVKRSSVIISGGYEWTVTFLSESPAIAGGRTLQLVTNKLVAAQVTVDVGASLDPAHVGAESKTVVIANGATQWTSAGVESYAAVGMYAMITGTGASAGIWRVVGVATDTLTMDSAFPGDSSTYTAQVGWTVPGALPRNYRRISVDASQPQTYTIAKLAAGQEIYARVSACNSLGCNAPRDTTPLTLAPPKQKPAEPRSVQILTESATTLRIFWSHPSSDGGDVIRHYRIDWDPTFTFDSVSGSPLGSEIKSVANPGVDCVFSPCEAVLGALTRGTPYYVRVYAYNSFGYSRMPGVSLPPFGIPKTQPSPPPVVRVEPSVAGDNTPAIRIQFDPQHDNGGAPVTQYLVEWDAMDVDAIYARAIEYSTDAAALSDEILYARHSTQLLLLSADAYDVRGTLRLAFRNHATPSLPWDVTADALTDALEALPTVGRVQVRRYATPSHNGFAWFVRFLTQQTNANALPLLQVSIDTTELVAAFGSSKIATAATALTGTNAKIETTTVIKQWNGFEQQQVTVSASAGTLGGGFQLGYLAQKTPSLPYDASEKAVQSALETLGTPGSIKVFKAALGGVSGFQYTVLFLSRLGGNQPLLSCDGAGLTSTVSSATYTCVAVRVVPGARPVFKSSFYRSLVVPFTAVKVVSANTAQLEITDGIVAGVGYHVRVSAWNGVGNVYGESMYSTPALVVAQSRPALPQDLSVEPISSQTLLATWTTPLSTGGSPLAQVSFQWDAQRGIAEQQSVRVLSQLSQLGGTFAIGVEGSVERTSALPWDVSATDFKRQLESLTALAGTIDSVSRRSVVLGGFGYEWVVVFKAEHGDVPTLTIADSGANLLGTDAAITVEQRVQGTVQSFVSPLPASQSISITPVQEIQEVFLFSRSREDLGGSVTLAFCGDVTPSIAVDATADAIRTALEGLSTLQDVEVTTTLVKVRASTSVRQQYGVKWTITFSKEQAVDLPLLLVSTDASVFTTSACGGAMTGSSPCVIVRKVRKGGLPTTALLGSGITNTSRYDIRVQTSNEAFTIAKPTQLPTAAVSKNRPASAPLGVVVSPLAINALGVSWRAPQFHGGLPVTQYKVQWDVSTQFDQQSILAGSEIVASTTATQIQDDDSPGARVDVFSLVIPDLDPAVQYYVRVLAYNSLGYGEPSAVATPVDAHERIDRVVVEATDITTALAASQTFKLSFSNYAGQTTSSISVNADAATVEAALNALPMVGVVSVSRTVQSKATVATPFDDSGVDTPAEFRLEWTITFTRQSRERVVPTALGTLAVSLDAAPTGPIAAGSFTVYPVRAGAAYAPLPSFVSPQSMPSMGPTNVKVSAVDSTSLGVSWSVPTVGTVPTKYLVEWSPAADFLPAQPRATGATYVYAASFTHIVTTTTYTIRGLTTATPYYVRVSAYNGDVTNKPGQNLAYSSPVLATVLDSSKDDAAIPTAETIAPTAQLPYKPTMVNMRVSTRDIASQIEVLFSEPTVNALGFTANDGGAAISQYRVTWDTHAEFLNAPQSYDVRMASATANAPLSCSVAGSPCIFPLGAAIQTVALSPDTTAGSFRLAIATSTGTLATQFPTQVCAVCTLVFDPAANRAYIDYTGSTPDLKTVLGTGAVFVIDRDGAAPCTFTAAASTVAALGGVATRMGIAHESSRCALPDGTYSVHTRLQSSTCLTATTLTADDIKTQVVSLLNDDVAVSVDSSFGANFRVTFTGTSFAFPAETPRLQVIAADGTAGCTAVVGTVWTRVEVASGGVLPGVPYYIKVAALNDVGLGASRPATALCHDLPCVDGTAKLAAAAPPSAPQDVTVASDRTDRSQLIVKWKAPATANGSPVRSYFVEYSVDAFATVALCAGCASSLIGGATQTLTLKSNVVIAAGTLVRLSSLTPQCLVVVQTVASAWDSVQIVYSISGNHGCDDVSSAAVNVEAVHGTDSGFVALVPTTVQDTGLTSSFTSVLTGLHPNTGYTVRVRAQNGEGLGAGTIATPVCEAGIEACVAAAVGISPPVIITRQLPSPPSLTVPKQLVTGPMGTSNELGFTKDSAWISFHDPNDWYGREQVDWYRVEWDALPTFTSDAKQAALVPLAGVSPSLWSTTELCSSCVTALSASDTLTITNPNNDIVVRAGDVLTVDQGTTFNCQFTVVSMGSATSITVATGHNCPQFTAQTLAFHLRSSFVFELTGLTMGVPIHVRVSAHNSLGYGAASDSLSFTPIVSSDPPPSPDVTLSVLTRAESDVPADRVSSLVVRFLPPKIKQPTDLVGAGGAKIAKYLVEWTTADWTTGFQSHVQVIAITSSSNGKVSGEFRLSLDTTGCPHCQIQGVHSTAAIPHDATASELTTILQNLPNVGQVQVTMGNGGVCTAKEECTWQVTFLSEIGQVPDFTVAQGRLSAQAGAASVSVSSLVAQGGRVGNVNGNLYCPTTGGASGRASCGVVMVTPSDTLPYRFVIPGLTPGTTYFARVSAFHDLCYGLRRISAPASLRVPFEPPTTPSSLFSAISRPVLTLAGPTSLLVSYGPPGFSGGTPVTAYRIEWDPRSTFDSGVNGDALGDVVIAGATGGEYMITGLTSGIFYHVRVFAVNAEVGPGLPVTTSPAREMPRGKPALPRDVTIENNQQLAPLGSSITVRWRASAGTSLAVTSYRIEWYERALASPFFGAQAVQQVQTSGTVSGGTFTLAFGDDVSTFRTLPGTVNVVQGQGFLTTSDDLTGLLSRGDLIRVDGALYLVAASGDFTPTRVPLASATNYAGSLASALGSVAATYAGITKIGLVIQTPWKTTPLAFDVTPSAMKDALEMLPSVVGLVHVERVQVGVVASMNYRWLVTFTSHVPSPAAVPLLIANDRKLTGTNNVDASVSVTNAGQPPLSFMSAVVPVGKDADPTTTMAFNITRLLTGTPYYVRVAAENDRGYGGFASAVSVVDGTQALAPTRVPLALENAQLRAVSRSLVALTFDQVDFSGGQRVSQYTVETDTSYLFDSANKQSRPVAPTATFHRVTTAAHTGPFTSGSTFTLSTIDDARGFKGDFRTQVDSYASAALLATTGFLTRIKPDVTTGFGSADWNLVFSRGEHVRVRNSDLKVCLDSAVKFTLGSGVVSASYDPGTTTLTLAAPLTPTMQDYVVAQTVLSVGPSCRTTVAQVVSTTELQLTHTCADALITAANLAIAVHWGPAVLPLCPASDPWRQLDSDKLTALVAQLTPTSDPLPLFQLDTAVGVAFDLVASPATPGTSSHVALLSTLAIECGEYIRLGDPSEGPIFRVRGKCDLANNCDCVMASATGVLQLGSVDDFTAAVSLSSDALRFATREVQTIKFFTTTDDLDHGTGGFRLKFGDEITATTLRGGNGGVSLNDDVGCLLWSSGTLSADAAKDISSLEAELESLEYIDDVRVTRTLTTSPTVLTYTIEFLGVRVRGRLPSLQVQDVGTNGCSAFAGAVLQTPTVQKDQLSYATIYKAPTTMPIPFDATDHDVIAVLEQLSSVSNVAVSRQVNKHGFDWKVTHVSANDGRQLSPPALAANGFHLSAVQSPKISVTPFYEVELPVPATSGAGTSLFARVMARNAVGLGEPSTPLPAFVQPANQLPGAAALLRTQVASDSEVLVEWMYPRDDGGLDVSEYKVEWWIDGGARQSQVVHHLESATAVVDVNRISLSAPTAGARTFVGGTFQVGFDGQWTPQLAYDTSALAMETALTNLSTIHASGLRVSRVLDPNGYTWLVTFAGAKNAGDQHRRRLSRLDQRRAHKLAVKAQNLMVCTTAQRSDCQPTLPNSIAASVVVGTTLEVQTLTCTGTPSAAVTFQLQFMGVATAAIASNADVDALQQALEAIDVAGFVAVRFRDPAQTTLCMAASPGAIEIEFLTERGDLPLLVATSLSGGLLSVDIVEARKGRAQRVVGRLPYSYLIKGLTAGSTYNVRVAAYNSLGYGAFTVAQPERGVVPAACAPMAPQSLSVRARLSSESLLVVWEEPQSRGGSPVTSYRVEWDTSTSFTSSCGERSEVQTLRLSHTSLPTASTQFKLKLDTTDVGCVDWQISSADLQDHLRLLGGSYTNAVVTTFGDDTARWDYGHTYTVTFVTPVGTSTSSFPLGLPLFQVNMTDATCNDYPGTVSIDRVRFGPGQDTKTGQGKIDATNNECSARLLEPIGRQVLTEATALANGVATPALQLALSTLANPYDGSDNVVLGAHAPILCAACVQKMVGDTLTVTTSQVGVLAGGDYFLVEEVLVAAPTALTSATVGRKCVLKAIAVVGFTITIDAMDSAFTNGVGCQVPIPFDSKAWQLKRFNLRAHTITDLFPGREYSVRVAAISRIGESVAAVV